jgi:hypothetical protein
LLSCCLLLHRVCSLDGEVAAAQRTRSPLATVIEFVGLDAAYVSNRVRVRLQQRRQQQQW